MDQKVGKFDFSKTVMMMMMMMIIMMMNCFCAMVDLQTAESRISGGDHRQEASPS